MGYARPHHDLHAGGGRAAPRRSGHLIGGRRGRSHPCARPAPSSWHAPRARPTATGTTAPGASPGRRIPARIVLATPLGIIRGDKHMANAYPPARRSAVAARDGNTDVRQHAES
jgi:hypothetical protein